MTSAHASAYARNVTRLIASISATEPSFYAAIKDLLGAVLAERRLPFEVRVATSEHRHGGSSDLPDLALYDSAGEYLVICGEVKLPDVGLKDLALSSGGDDQIGRYLAQTAVVLLSNVREFGVVTAAPGNGDRGPVPRGQRRLERVVKLWETEEDFRRGRPVRDDAFDELADLIEQAITRHAPIAEPESLARILALQARHAKSDLPARFTDAVQDLLEDFGTALGVKFVGKEGEEFFRSSLIQTAYYGLFAGWALWWQQGAKGTFRWEDVSDYLRIPFLGELFHEFRHPKRLKELRLKQHLDDATETLGRVDRDRFFNRFHLPTIDEQDPAAELSTSAITYFYEPFLEAFDPELRKQLGVWYTPIEIVRYQVRRVDQILRTDLGCRRGFADPKVVVLDPCCGTGAYLIEVLRCIASQLRSEGVGALLGQRLLSDACSRICGFELLTAPFVVAQLQMYLLFSQLGAEPQPDQRLAVFLTNALTGWEGGEDYVKMNFPELEAERASAGRVKRDARIIVVLGNPPYNRFAGVPPIDDERNLIDDYKGIQRDGHGRQVGNAALFSEWGIQKQTLDDLYIRFFRLAERRIGERAPFGVVSFISNYSFYLGRSHPIMRESLLRSFDEIWIDSLNGDKYTTGKVIPKGLPGEGTTDQSVFTTDADARGIQVGTGITTLVKKGPRPADQTAGKVFYRDFWGRADAKRRALLDSLDSSSWSDAQRVGASRRPEGPRDYATIRVSRDQGWVFADVATSDRSANWPKLNELFTTTVHGANPNRGIEGSVVEIDPSVLESRMRDYFSACPFDELAARHPELCKNRSRYDARELRKQLVAKSQFTADRIVPFLLFPFDLRWLYYETGAKLLDEHSPELWKNLAGNEFLVSVPHARRPSEARPLLVTTSFFHHLNDRGAIAFPMLVVESSASNNLFERSAATSRTGNLARNAAPALCGVHGRHRGADDRGMVHDLFRLILAATHAPKYEAEHHASLKTDWARIPIPRDCNLFRSMVDAGDRIALLLNPLLEATDVIVELVGNEFASLGAIRRIDGRELAGADLCVTRNYFGAAKGDWRDRAPAPGEQWCERWSSCTGDLYLNDDVFVQHVPEAVWNYELGGYPVLKKWLGGREAGRRGGKPMTADEAEQLQSIVRRIAALLVLHGRLDDLYERAAPDAFTCAELGIKSE